MLAAEVAPAIVSQLTTSAITLEALLFQHLLHSQATLKQRAAMLKLLHMSLAPHHDFANLIAKQPASGISNSSSSAHANAAGLDASASTQNLAGSYGSVEPKAGEQHDPSLAGQALLDSKSPGCQQLCIKLFTMVLQALPSLIKAAVCRSSNSSEAPDSPAQAAQTDAQQAQGVKNQAQQEQQDAEAEAFDSNAMHALLSLVLHVATDNGLHGMLVVLAFPTALGPILPELLASSQVSYLLLLLHLFWGCARLQPTVHSWGECYSRQRRCIPLAHAEYR